MPYDGAAPGSDSATKAKDYLRHFGQLEGDRGIWNSHWDQIERRVMARQSGFISSVVPGQKWTQDLFDSTAVRANERFAAACESVLCPRGQRWHGLEPQDPSLANDQDVKRWCEALADLLFRVRYGSRSMFASETQECLLELGAFGTMGMMVSDISSHVGIFPQPSPIVYQAVPLSHMWIEENSLGQVDTVYRKFVVNGRRAVQQFGKDKLPARVLKSADEGTTEKWTFVHAMHPTNDHDKGAWDYRRFPYTSCYVLREDPQVVAEGGFRRNPYSVSRALTSADEQYGRSIAMSVLPEIKMANEVGKTIIRVGQKMLDPPLLLADDGMGNPFDLRSNALNYGHVDMQGHPLVRPLETGGDYKIGVDAQEKLHTAINDAFLITLFQILVENKEMTAYEAALRAQEKGQLLAPTMGRQEAEFLAPIIEREIDILWNRGMIQRALGPMPAALQAAGGALKVVYRNQMAMFQKAPEAARTLMAVQQLAPMAELDPSVLDGFDPAGVFDVIVEANGVPQKALRSKADRAAAAKNRQDQAAMQQLQAAAPVAAQVGAAAKDLTAAHATAQAAQPALPLGQAA